MSRGTFLITGFGRSGTMFLACALNQSPTWEVAHEPAGDQDSRDAVCARFARRTRYGEVNSRVRNWVQSVPAERKAIILRNPREIAVSVYNRCQEETAARLEGVWRLLDSHIRAGLPVFRLEEFTQHEAALRRIAMWAGIDDAPLEAGDVKHKRNSSTDKIIDQYAEIPQDVRSVIDAEISWFSRRHGYD